MATVTLLWSTGAFLLAFGAVRLVEWAADRFERQEIPPDDRP